MFDVGDTILYASCGVCRIEGVELKEFRGEEREYFLLCSVSENTLYYVPKGSPDMERRMRALMSADELTALLREPPQEIPEWQEDNNLRRQEFTATLTTGSIAEVLQLICSLQLKEQERKLQRKKLYVADEKTLRDAEKLVCSELCYVLGMTDAEAKGSLPRVIL